MFHVRWLYWVIPPKLKQFLCIMDLREVAHDNGSGCPDPPAPACQLGTGNLYLKGYQIKALVVLGKVSIRPTCSAQRVKPNARRFAVGRDTMLHDTSEVLARGCMVKLHGASFL